MRCHYNFFHLAYYYFKEDYFESPDLIYPLLVKKILPLPLFGLFAAIILGAVLSTFNSVLNSASTIFCHDIYKKLINKNCNDKRLVIIGKNVSIILAILAIGIAPLVAFAPDGLYFLLQELNGIFFIPISSIIIAGIFFKKINTNGAKAGLFFGFIFYILSTFIFNLNIHFVHLWGIEFLLNFIIMFSISHLYPLNQNIIENIVDVGDEWKWIKPIGLVLCSITILIYILLS